GATRTVATSTVATVPANRLAPTARPSRLQPVRPNSPSGDSHARPMALLCTHPASPPVAATHICATITQAQTAKATTMPTVAARAGVCGRHTANASAGTSVASAENDTAPTSASASLPAIWRLYAQASSMVAAMPIRRSSSTSPRRSPSPPPRDQAPRSSPGANQWLPIIRLSVSVLTTTMPVAALSPPRNANSATPSCPRENGSASAYMSDGTPSPSSAVPARASGSAGSAISSRYSGNCQRAVRTSSSPRQSTTPPWNWCGRMNIASAPSSTSGANPSVVCRDSGAGTSGSASSPNHTNAPSASIAASLNTDSNAIASTSPRLCSTALARRVPNSIANSAIASATYSETS